MVCCFLALTTPLSDFFWRGCSYTRLPCITVDEAKHYIGTGYSGKEQLTCVRHFSLIPSHHKTGKLAAKEKNISDWRLQIVYQAPPSGPQEIRNFCHVPKVRNKQ